MCAKRAGEVDAGATVHVGSSLVRRMRALLGESALLRLSEVLADGLLRAGPPLPVSKIYAFIGMKEDDGAMLSD